MKELTLFAVGIFVGAIITHAAMDIKQIKRNVPFEPFKLEIRCMVGYCDTMYVYKIRD